MGNEQDICFERKTTSSILVPVALFTECQPLIGPLAVAAWLNLRVLIETDQKITARDYLMGQMDLDGRSVDNILERLENVGLIQAVKAGWVLKEPGKMPHQQQDVAEQSPEDYQESFWDQIAASTALEGVDLSGDATTEEQALVSAEVNPDLDSVLDLYANRIGLIGPTQYQKLENWIESKHMSVDVIALAIEETALSAKTPRFEYLEGILRNWSNDGIRTVDDMIKKKVKVRALAGIEPKNAKPENYEGWPNATAYNVVDENRLKLWKELYPDE
ncbi:MAG: DnaD domain protein [Limnochordia bacterium]|jgi:DnaD/phage-associated family protein|nr:DnaD domain protein [Limnochordia bacterium]